MTTTDSEIQEKIDQFIGTYVQIWNRGITDDIAKRALTSLFAEEKDKLHIMYRADIAQAIGYCQGLGHPDSYLERRYPDIASIKEQGDKK